MSVERRAKHRQLLLEPRQRRHPLIVESKGLHPFLGDDAGARAGGQRLLHELPRIVGRTGPRHEGIALAHLTAVDHQPTRTGRAQPAQRLVNRGVPQESGGHHQKLSSTAGTLATICDFTSASGGTLSKRRVWPTTWLNTGAATAPP